MVVSPVGLIFHRNGILNGDNGIFMLHELLGKSAGDNDNRKRRIQSKFLQLLLCSKPPRGHSLARTTDRCGLVS
ncbi:hypothetical protein EYR41_008726 [Orbilia oligospora]|uniref:Uncharacterized protein n=1 Tax=Orbilia oligospora TaxID=2813651 RepID=A0A8H2DVR9_ORBOL|nr:hypothetical protein EYR41_008726 [Orbilia oligospora]